MIRRLLVLCVCLCIGSLQGAQHSLHIGGQEGDERFFGLLRAIYYQMGFDVEFSLIPSERALSLVNSGQLDAEVGRIPDLSGKYPQLHYSAEPLLDVKLVALIKKGSAIKLSSAKDLRSYRVGHLIGMNVAENYSKQNGLKVLSVPTHLQLAQMLELERLDVVLMGTAFTQSPVFEVAEHGLLLSSASVYHIFHKKYAHLAPQFDQILAEMKNDGRYDKHLTAVAESH